MLALTSCSTVGNMHPAPAPAPKPYMMKHHVAKTHQQVSKQRVAKHKAPSVHPISSKHVYKAPAKSPVSKPVVKQEIMPTRAQIHTAKPATVASSKPQAPQVKVIAVTELKPATKHAPTPIYVAPALLIETKSFEMTPRQYKKLGRRRDVIADLDYLDKHTGQYHYIQVVHWDGRHISESITNARLAKLEALIGLGMYENSYLDTPFGPTIILLGGSAYLTNIRGMDFDLILINAKSVPPRGKKYSQINDESNYLSEHSYLKAALQNTLSPVINSICTVNEADNSDNIVYQLPAYVYGTETLADASQLQIMNLQPWNAGA
jgi:hypothetical protein